MTTEKPILEPIGAAAATALVVTFATALLVFGCSGGGGGGTADSGSGSTPDGGVSSLATVSGVAANGPLIGVTLSLTCADGTTKVTAIAGTDAKPGEFAFTNVPGT